MTEKERAAWVAKVASDLTRQLGAVIGDNLQESCERTLNELLEDREQIREKAIHACMNVVDKHDCRERKCMHLRDCIREILLDLERERLS